MTDGSYYEWIQTNPVLFALVVYGLLWLYAFADNWRGSEKFTWEEAGVNALAALFQALVMLVFAVGIVGAFWGIGWLISR